MSRWITQNLGLFLLSLVLAFFFWAVATESEDPTRVDAFSTPIPVEIRGLAEGMIAYGIENPHIRVEIRAPVSVWRVMSVDDINAFIDLSSVGTGTLTVPVEVDLRIKPAVVTKVSPKTFTVIVERIAEKDVPVEVHTQGAPAMGFKLDNVEVAPQSVHVRGPESLVQRVTKAQIKITIQDRQSGLQGDYQPILVDQDGEPVPQVECSPKLVTVNVAISQLGYIRDMPVTVGPLEGQPAPGYRIANLEFDPPVVKVFGRTDVVQSVAFLQTEPINLEGITQSLTTRVRLQMPEGLSVIQPSRPEVTVTLTVEVIRSGLTLEVTPTVTGLSSGLRAVVGPNSVVVILSGPLAVMEALDPAHDVTVTLDATGLTPGEHVLVPHVSVPNQVDVENIIPKAVPVKIEPYVVPEQRFD